MTTRWSTGFSDPQWIYVDLGTIYSVKEVRLFWEAWGLEYRIELSNDATNWTAAYHETNADGRLDVIPVSASGRYVRMYGIRRGTGWGYSLFEFEVYDVTPPPPPTLTPTATPTGQPPTPTPTLPGIGSLLWSDDFDDGDYAGWEVVSGVWGVTDGCLVGHYPVCSGSYTIMTGDPAWTNFQLTLDLKRISGWDGPDIMLRHSAGGSYTVQIHPSVPYGGSAMLLKSGTGMVANVNWPFNAGVWYRIKIKLYGPRIEVWLVESTSFESLLISYTDVSPVFISGRIGLSVGAGALCDSEVWFDNLQVAGLLD
jgi:hypothetical protein